MSADVVLESVRRVCGHVDLYEFPTGLHSDGFIAGELYLLSWYPCRGCTRATLDAHPDRGTDALRRLMRELLRGRHRPAGPMPETVRRHLRPRAAVAESLPTLAEVG